MANAFLSTLFMQMLAEMYDRNFEVIVFLSSWGPVWGMREGTRPAQAALVVVGVGLAFLLRIFLAWLWPSGLAGIVLLISPIALWGLAAKAGKDFTVADARPEARAVVGDNGQIELLPGASRDSTRSLVGEASERDLTANPYMKTEPMLMALVIPFCCTAAISLGDPLKANDCAQCLQSSFGAGITMLLGCICAAILAVLSGTLLEHTLSHRRFLLAAAVTLGLSALSATTKLIAETWVL